MKNSITILLLVFIAAWGSAQAEPRDRRAQRCEHHNYIIERQQIGAVQGPPTSRLIIGRRQIDGYRLPNGGRIWFERNNVVGVSR
jgi:hypothetical protein